MVISQWACWLMNFVTLAIRTHDLRVASYRTSAQRQALTTLMARLISKIPSYLVRKVNSHERIKVRGQHSTMDRELFNSDSFPANISNEIRATKLNRSPPCKWLQGGRFNWEQDRKLEREASYSPDLKHVVRCCTCSIDFCITCWKIDT